MLLLRCRFLAQSLGFVILVDITVLALAFGVHFSIMMLALSSKTLPPVSVIAVVTHALCKMLQISVLALCYQTSFATTFPSAL